MYALRILTGEQTLRMLDMGQSLSDVETAYRLFSKQEAEVFPIIVHHFESGKREMDIKSGHLSGAGVFGMKMLGFCSENPMRGLLPLAGMIVVMSVDTQQPIGIVDGAPVTFYRTGAAGGIAAKALARKDSKRVLIVGAGNQGRAQLMGLEKAVPSIEEIFVADVDDEISRSFVTKLEKSYPQFKFHAVPFSKLEGATRIADIIVTCTRAREHFLKKSWIKAGTHINAMGTDMQGKQEIEPELLGTIKVFADSRIQAVQKGECQYAAGAGLISTSAITEIGEVLEGVKHGRTTNEEITLFDATGMAIQDLMVAANLLVKAEALNMGITVDF